MTEKARSSRSSSSGQSEGAPGGASTHFLVGRVGRAVGLRGEVEVLIVSDEPTRFAPGSVVNISDGRRLTVQKVRLQGERTVVSFDEIADRTGAEALRGADLVVPIEAARPLEGNEFWDHDLVGCAVVTLGGDEVGTVSDVLHQPANEVLVVQADGKQILIPLVSTVVKSVEPNHRITIDPPAGLLD